MNQTYDSRARERRRYLHSPKQLEPVIWKSKCVNETQTDGGGSVASERRYPLSEVEKGSSVQRNRLDGYVQNIRKYSTMVYYSYLQICNLHTY